MAIATKRWVNNRIYDDRGLTHPRRLDIVDTAGGLALDSTVCFGYKLDPDGDNSAEVLIYSGEAHHGKRGIIDVSDTKKVITVDHQYVWGEYAFGSGVATIAGPSTSRPESDEATYRVWIYLFRLVDGVASRERVGHFGNIEIPGAYA